MNQTSPRKLSGYNAAQIALHWVIVAMVFFQIAFGEAMVEATDAAEESGRISASDALLASAHYWVGIGVLVLVALRLGLRLTAGAPEPAQGATSLIGRAAKAMHIAFYAMLVATPVLGLLTVYVDGELGDIHQLAKPIFIVLVVLHAGAALVHQFVLRDGTLVRMLVPERR